MLEDRTAPATFSVTSAADAGAGTLRQAILSANAAAGADTITIDLGAGLHTINLLSALPAITGKVSIDGSQSGPKLELNGSGAGAGANGLLIKASGTTIRGLILNRFAGNGIVITNNVVGGMIVPTSNVVVVGCFIGTNADGTAEAHNGLSGVAINGTAAGNRVGGAAPGDRNVLSGNLKNGVVISGPMATGNLVVGNLIGLSNAAGNPALPNGIDAVQVSGAKNNRIGGTAPGDGNTLSGNGRAGVTIQGAGATGNLVQGNSIGLNSTGDARPNLVGVWIAAGANGNTIGGTASDAGNTISGNTSSGVAFTGAGTVSNVLSNNKIGTTPNGAAARPNGLGGVRIIAGARSNRVQGNVISGNTGDGVFISRGGGNVLKGNSIGLNTNASALLANSLNGVSITLASVGNVIGGVTPADRNFISGNTLDGVLISDIGSKNNKVLGNYIGLDFGGNVALGNGRDGVEIRLGATANIIGGAALGAGNVISGNANNGVTIRNAGTTGNLVQGNFIGTDAGGSSARGNGSEGVLITLAAAGNTVGGAVAGARNVIAGNGDNGVSLFAINTQNNLVLGNFIGLSAGGNGILANTGDGVKIAGGAINNTIGGATVLARNVISGNGGNGVTIRDDGTGNKVLGNFIGTNAAGSVSLGNSARGVQISSGAHDNTIGGTVAGSRNVISGNVGVGVFVTNAGSTGNRVLGNYIGTNAAGSEALGNEFGVVIQAANNTVGGTVAAARNVISGNFSSGVVISLSSNSNKVQGNFIGTNAAGSADLGNGLRGVEISGGSSGNTIGGAVAGARNIISGNNGAGVSIGTSGTSANFVQGNFIGLDVTGTFAIGNNDFGVELFSSATFNLVGGSVAGRNVISGNGGDGVNIRGGATLNTVQANFIGTNAAGAADLGNGGAGVSFTAGANGNNLGGDVASVGNVISGNDGDGVLISGSGTDRNQVLNNFIGVAANKTSALGNDQNGVFIADGASRNAIEGNVIAHNADDGVLIGSNATIPTPAGNRNSVLGNSIFANGNLGIDLGPDDGVTTNDSNDPDAGPNDLLNKPVLTGAFLLGDVLLLSGTINTELSKTLRIELFSTPTLNAAGQAEGKTFLGFIETDTDASNTVAFSTFLQTTKVKVGDFLTATATDQNGNTSEFSIGLAIV